ncbi:PRC-barrel domain-containing protein [Candidatus Saccharibacteria bacterium]|nr:PRC-barrel domain-containing protein [Candidatus Saccharibacteria bacterium]
MPHLASHIIQLPVFSVQDGGILGRVQKLIVNPDDFKIVMLQVHLQTKFRPRYLLPHDIKLVDNNKLIIESANDLAEDEDLVRLKPYIKQPFLLCGANVVTQSSKKLGRVNDFSLSTNDFTATKLYLKSRSIWQFFYASHIIDRNMVVDVKDDNKTIVVKDSTIKLQKTSPSVLPAKS